MTAFLTWQFPTNTGLTPRTLQTRLQEIFNVKDYGAVGNTVTNDTASIQDAIDAACNAGGGTVYFPLGYYLCNGVNFLTNKRAARLITLCGEMGADGFSTGSKIYGTSANPLIDSTDAFYATGDIHAGNNIIDNIVFTDPAGYDTSALQTGDPVVGVDLGVTGYTSVASITGPDSITVADNSAVSVTGEVIWFTLQPALARIDKLFIEQRGTGAAIRMRNGLIGVIDQCQIGSNGGGHGIIADVSISLTLTNSTITGNNSANTVGALAGGCLIYNNKFSNWTEGIRTWAVFGAIIANSFEVNSVAIKTGINSSGNSHTASAKFIAANETERCDTGFYFTNIQQSSLLSNSATGSVGVSGLTEPVYGFRIGGNCENLLFAGNSVTGKKSTAGFSVESGILNSCFDANKSDNTSVLGGVNWSLDAAAAANIDWRGCNLPSSLPVCTFAQLPTSPIVGTIRTVSNSSTTGWGDVVGGNGASSVLTQWNGSNWTVIGK